MNNINQNENEKTSIINFEYLVFLFSFKF